MLLVAALNLGYFGVEFAVALAIGSVSLFADSIDFLVAISITSIRRGSDSDPTPASPPFGQAKQDDCRRCQQVEHRILDHLAERAHQVVDRGFFVVQQRDAPVRP